MRDNFSGFTSAAGKVDRIVSTPALDSPVGTLIFVSFAALDNDATAAAFFYFVIRCLQGATRLGK